MLLALPLFALLQADPAAALTQWIDRTGQRQLDERDKVIAAIHTPAQAAERRQYVRSKILELIGGLPDYRGTLNAHVTGSIDAGGYTIEKVVFESLPKYFVTANLYLPKTAGPHPAVLFPLGHWEQGKPAAQQIAGNLALKGFVVLAYDPMGQGERLQAYDRRLGASLAGGSVNQHLQAGAQSLLIGESYARYHIWDAKRALDYLVSRSEVNPARIGATGCSGGGTITTYIAALDDRIAAAAPACYTNSWRKLLAGPTGDAEQTFAGFLASGLDMADYVELFSPKPWLMASTEEDFFTPAGAKIVYDEAKRWYEMIGAEGHVKWVVGPGGHGTPLPVREAIYEWMQRWLDDGKGSPKEQDVQLRPDFEFLVTKSGQVSTDFETRQTVELIRDRYQELRQPAGPQALRSWVKQQVQHQPAASTGWAGDRFTIQTADGIELSGQRARGQAGAPVAIFVGSSSLIDLEAAARTSAGDTVVRFLPRGLPASANRDLIGDWITNARVSVIGKNLPLLRASDILDVVDMVAPGSPGGINVYASDIAGIWALFAAAADTRISHLELIRTPHDFRSSLDSPVNRGLYEAAVPGFLLRGDLPELVTAIGLERVVWLDPVDWMRNAVQLPGATYSTFAH